MPGDPDRLRQIVWNLLSNAVKFTPPRGTVSLALVPASTGVRLEVSDTGRGIEPAFLPHVFDRFSQAEGEEMRGVRGLGIGLAIVRELAEAHGGAVEATQRRSGHGRDVRGDAAGAVAAGACAHRALGSADCAARARACEDCELRSVVGPSFSSPLTAFPPAGSATAARGRGAAR